MQLFDQLLQFPLFQGMSHDDLAMVAGRTKFSFLKYRASQVVVTEDEPCNQMFFLLSGTLRVETRSDDHNYSVVEELLAPYMVQPEAIFGYYQRYTHTFHAQTECSFLAIGKEEVRRLCGELLVFRLNLLNLFATQSQKQLRQPWRHYPETLSDRIVRFFAQRCVYPAGPKTFHILMTQLANEVGDSRLDVSRALNKLQREGLLQLHRGRIEIPQMERLLA
jgi:CRP-like cAMP-binding protein